MSLAHEAELDHQLQILLDGNVIQESTGSFMGEGVLVFLVFKEDKQGNPIKPRIVIDFEHTNKMIVGITA